MVHMLRNIPAYSIKLEIDAWIGLKKRHKLFNYFYMYIQFIIKDVLNVTKIEKFLWVSLLF